MSTQSPAGDHNRQTTGSMERVTTRVPGDDISALESLVDAGRFPNRSEAIRAAIRQLVASETGGDSDA